MKNQTFKAELRGDGEWWVTTEDDVVAYAARGNEQAKATMIAGALNASTTFVPANRFGVKPGYHTRPDIVRLLRLHRMFPERVQFIADMME
jgi:hypothetical protein